MLQKGAPIDWLQKQMGHRNFTMLIRHYWRWINPGELSQETLARLGAVKNSSNQPHPDPEDVIFRNFDRNAPSIRADHCSRRLATTPLLCLGS